MEGLLCTGHSTNPFPDTVLFIILQGSDYPHLIVRKLVLRKLHQWPMDAPWKWGVKTQTQAGVSLNTILF